MMNTVRSLMSSQSISTAYRSIFKQPTPQQGYKKKNEKGVESGSNVHVQYGCVSVKGYRPTMEDEYNAILEVPSELCQDTLNKSDHSPIMYFAVYDGHGGTQVSKKLSEELYAYVMKDEISRKTNETKSVASPGSVVMNKWLQDDSYIKQKFMSFDKQLKHNTACGSTAVTVFLSRDPITNSWEVICSNTGDSSAVLFDQGTTISLNRRHDVNIAAEKQRVAKARCEVYDDYVFSTCGNMSLAMTRAFGDYLFKNNKNQIDLHQAVIAEPDIIRVLLNNSKKDDYIKRESKFEKITKPKDCSPYTFLIIACDGIWDVMSYRGATKYVNEKLAMQDEEIAQGKRSGLDIASICSDLTKKCYHSKDNITVIIVLLNRVDDAVQNMGPA